MFKILKSKTISYCGIPRFLFLLTVPESLFCNSCLSSPLRLAELMLRGPVGFRAGTALKLPDVTPGADRIDCGEF